MNAELAAVVCVVVISVTLYKLLSKLLDVLREGRVHTSEQRALEKKIELEKLKQSKPCEHVWERVLEKGGISTAGLHGKRDTGWYYVKECSKCCSVRLFKFDITDKPERE